MQLPRKRSSTDAGLSPPPRVGTKVPKSGSGTIGPGTLSAFIYDTGRQTGGKLDHQVKYGPGLGFSTQERGQLHRHYGTKAVTSRYTQYNANRNVYVQSAQAMGRGLTVQESKVQQGLAPGPTSIDHIIASGTGQHALNRSTLDFLGGQRTALDGSNSLQTRFGGIAQQAAAVGRMRSLGREILREETGGHGYGTTFVHGNRNQVQLFVEKRNRMSHDLLNAFETGSEVAYKRYMKHTFDSPGNLRLGHSSGNSRVSTGFDMPLDHKLAPTQRGERLLNAYRSFGFEDMQRDAKVGKRNNVGTFTSNLRGQSLSSSRQVSGDTQNHAKRFL